MQQKDLSSMVKGLDAISNMVETMKMISANMVTCSENLRYFEKIIDRLETKIDNIERNTRVVQDVKD